MLWLIKAFLLSRGQVASSMPPLLPLHKRVNSHLLHALISRQACRFLAWTDFQISFISTKTNETSRNLKPCEYASISLFKWPPRLRKSRHREYCVSKATLQSTTWDIYSFVFFLTTVASRWQHLIPTDPSFLTKKAKECLTRKILSVGHETKKKYSKTFMLMKL